MTTCSVPTFLPALGDVRLCDLDRERLQDLLTAKLRSGLSWETAHHIRCVLSKVLTAAEEWGYVGENFARQVKLPRRQTRSHRPFLGPTEVRLLISNLREPCRTITLLLVLTGCRIGELLALRRKHVNLEKAVLCVRETVYQGRFGPPKTASGLRDVPLGPEAVAALAAQLQRISYDPEALMFPNAAGKPLDPHNLLWRELYLACDARKLLRVSWHSFRHTHITLRVAMLGEPVSSVQLSVGHRSSRVTLEAYTHTIAETQRAAVERLERLICGGGSEYSSKLTQIDPNLAQQERAAPLVQ